jgi:hypothetical protein
VKGEASKLKMRVNEESKENRLQRGNKIEELRNEWKTASIVPKIMPLPLRALLQHEHLLVIEWVTNWVNNQKGQPNLDLPRMNNVFRTAFESMFKEHYKLIVKITGQGQKRHLVLIRVFFHLTIE